MAKGGLSGGDKLTAHLAKMAEDAGAKPEVRVGFLENATYPDGKPVAMIAAIQEFGAPRAGIPPRPFFRNAIQKHSKNWGNDTAKAMRATGMDTEKSLALMGDRIKSQIQQSIKDTNAPPLSPVTLLLRERFGNKPDEITFADVQQARYDVAMGATPNVTATQAKPLVWTGHLWNSVDYEVKS